ncbi:lanC-like protein 1 [Mizuhopecten yessoensis]|uniref:LanC-like protein 2 n=1 Tax=Mizuhopecten yessoensis TaxID=6573 RepID=A0A210PS92_MIZYE|nr:lanC-like protein 1 [Mizuhopecten yessoensis]OWF39348.1 LanC-like protein 2 [Mizuhopecten yessoensis]
MDGRAFENKFSAYDGKSLVGDDGKLLVGQQEVLRSHIDRLLQKLNTGLDEDADTNYSVYTGMGGIAFLHWHMYNKLDKDPQYLEQAYSYIKHHLRHLKGRRVTFLCGDAGPLALGAVVCSEMGKADKSQELVERLEAMHDGVCSDRNLPDEILFGRAGYLSALLFVQHHLGADTIDNSIIYKIFQSVIDRGRGLSREKGFHHPLMYQWHDKYYLGAAHGLAGILTTLMQVQDPTGKYKSMLIDFVKPSVDYMLDLRYPSGNGPSSLKSENGDKLIHWCHGAPGWIHLFVSAYKTFTDSKYLDAAKKCADVIWERGLLKKGYGICHGTAGNAYAFLTMYKLTSNQEYLYKAYKFAEWCFDYEKHGCHTADTPFSLFEGMAGTIYFLIDLLDPSKAYFPAFEL